MVIPALEPARCKAVTGGAGADGIINASSVCACIPADIARHGHLWLACRSWSLWESALFVHLVNTRIRVFRLYADVYMHRPRRYKQRQLRTLVQKQRDGVLDTLEQCLLSVVELLLYAYLLLSC
jgi:hypothetical protein